MYFAWDISEYLAPRTLSDQTKCTSDACPLSLLMIFDEWYIQKKYCLWFISDCFLNFHHEIISVKVTSIKQRQYEYKNIFSCCCCYCCCCHPLHHHHLLLLLLHLHHHNHHLHNHSSDRWNSHKQSQVSAAPNWLQTEMIGNFRWSTDQLKNCHWVILVQLAHFQ